MITRGSVKIKGEVSDNLLLLIRADADSVSEVSGLGNRELPLHLAFENRDVRLKLGENILAGNVSRGPELLALHLALGELKLGDLLDAGYNRLCVGGEAKLLYLTLVDDVKPVEDLSAKVLVDLMLTVSDEAVHVSLKVEVDVHFCVLADVPGHQDHEVLLVLEGNIDHADQVLGELGDVVGVLALVLDVILPVMLM